MAPFKKKITPPLTSESQYKETRLKINARNRDRSKLHERRVAAILKGSRVPMSGAMKEYKGDVIVNFINHPGKYVIECKLSSQLSPEDSPQLSFMFVWLSKLQYEVEITNAKFGIFVLHFHNKNILKDYVLIHESDATLLVERYEGILLPELARIINEAPLYDIRYKEGNVIRKSFFFIERRVIPQLVSIGGIFAARYHTPNGIYILMHLHDFRDIMNDI